jgi:ABC-type lipopolysaccharide export system ATPase subunit
MPQGLETPAPFQAGDKVAVRVTGLSHRYGAKVALDGLSLDISQGTIFGVLGPNGSGKSTLFRLLSTLVPIQSGQIHICGLDAKQEQQQVREQIGVVFQSPSLDRKLTARENIEFQSALYGISKTERIARVDELSRALAIQEHLDTRVDKLSGGLVRDSPEHLRTSTGQMVFTIASSDPTSVIDLLSTKYGLSGVRDHGLVRVVMQESAVSPMELYEGLGSMATSITIGRPSLEDVFIKMAGKSFS